MTTKATRRRQSTRRRLYLAFELSLKDWKLAFSTGLGDKPLLRRVAAGDLNGLVHAIERAKRELDLPTTVPVASCYEAGREGFWLHRYLRSIGVCNRIVDSASIEVNRRKRRAKSDRLDATKLVSMLIRSMTGEKQVWSEVRVPAVAAEDRRHHHRELRTLKQDKTRVTNRIKGYLFNQGIRLKRVRELPQLLEDGRLWNGDALPPALCRRLEREWHHLQFLHEQILEIESERREELKRSKQRNVERIRQLICLRGVGIGSASILVREFFDWRQFRNGKQVGALAGLVPTPYQSGESSREQGISKAGNRHVRGIAVQLGWSWLRYQPQSRLSLWYEERFGRGGPRARKVGIVALARKLLVDLWRFLEWGVVPAGAELAA
jgi:transposase